MAATKNESISSTTSDKSSKFKMKAQNQDLKVVVRDDSRNAAFIRKFKGKCSSGSS
jgi:hypothetical protein